MNPTEVNWVSEVLSGGGMLALAFVVWLQQRDHGRVLGDIREMLARLLQESDVHLDISRKK